VRIAAYVYPGWHAIEERDRSFYPGFTEWDLVYACAPRFPGHAQPRLPRDGRYDDRDPVAVGERVALARAHGIDAFVYGFFWCRGKRVFQAALDEGLLGSREGARFPFALMWANRMPRRVLPVRRADLPVIDPARRVDSDVDDFVRLIGYLCERYFTRENYLRVAGRIYFSIFDSTHFLQEMGFIHAKAAIRAARDLLRERGLELHLAAIEPSCRVIDRVREAGFDSVTHYVLLPDWKGPFLQPYAPAAAKRAGEWAGIARASGLPCFPSVSPGWDASPRAADFGVEKPRKYPWWPVVVEENPDAFEEALARAVRFARAELDEPLAFVASWNEWSEGHAVEPCARFGARWLEAIARARSA